MHHKVELLTDAAGNSLFQLHAQHFVDLHALVLVQIWQQVSNLLISLGICKRCQIFLWHFPKRKAKKKNENENNIYQHHIKSYMYKFAHVMSETNANIWIKRKCKRENGAEQQMCE